MTCGKCNHCSPIENVAGTDCECKTKSDSKIQFEVSQDDDIRFYGEQNDEPCELSTTAG